MIKKWGHTSKGKLETSKDFWKVSKSEHSYSFDFDAMKNEK